MSPSTFARNLCDAESNVSRVHRDTDESSQPSSLGSEVGSHNGLVVSPAEREAAILQDQEAQRAVILSSLSNQLEYYFSLQNLSKDTYLQTLSSLNDGCVPVAVLAKFQKVKSILPQLPESTRASLVVQAASEFSEVLRVVYIDGQTSKRMEEGSQVQPTSILAISTWDGKPLTSLPSASASSIAEEGSTTVILREVPDNVTEKDVKDLFSFDDCPSVASIRLDVGQCWFVTLVTDSSPSEMVGVMQQLQTKSLGGRPVLARRKASSASTVPIDPAPLWLAPLPPKRKKKVRSRKKKKKSLSAVTDSGSSGFTSTLKANPPPLLGEDDFPALHDKQVEWETPSELEAHVGELYSDKESMRNDEDDSQDNRKSTKTLSDVASTATTTSSSTESTPQGKKVWGAGGYAAALMKLVPPAVNEHRPSFPTAEAEASVQQEFQSLAVEERNAPAPVVNVPNSSWSNSFASVLLNETESS